MLALNEAYRQHQHQNIYPLIRSLGMINSQLNAFFSDLFSSLNFHIRDLPKNAFLIIYFILYFAEATCTTFPCHDTTKIVVSNERKKIQAPIFRYVFFSQTQ